MLYGSPEQSRVSVAAQIEGAIERTVAKMQLALFMGITFAITGVQKQSEAALLHVRVDGIVGQLARQDVTPMLEQIRTHGPPSHVQMILASKSMTFGPALYPPTSGAPRSASP